MTFFQPRICLKKSPNPRMHARVCALYERSQRPSLHPRSYLNRTARERDREEWSSLTITSTSDRSRVYVYYALIYCTRERSCAFYYYYYQCCCCTHVRSLRERVRYARTFQRVLANPSLSRSCLLSRLLVELLSPGAEIPCCQSLVRLRIKRRSGREK